MTSREERKCQEDALYRVQTDKYTTPIWMAISSQQNTAFYLTGAEIHTAQQTIQLTAGCEVSRRKPPFDDPYMTKMLFEKIVTVSQLSELGDAVIDAFDSKRITPDDEKDLKQNRYYIQANITRVLSQTMAEAVYKACECCTAKVTFVNGLYVCKFGHENPSFQFAYRLQLKLTDVQNPEKSIIVTAFDPVATDLLGHPAEDVQITNPGDYEEAIRHLETCSIVIRLRANFYQKELTFNVDHLF